MSPSLAERLEQARDSRFVGRRSETDRFGDLLSSPEPAVIVVHGPAGIGKSTLMRRFGQLAQSAGTTPKIIDARDLPPTLDAVRERLRPVFDHQITGRVLIMIDHYELLAEIDAALREHLAPQLPEDVILVLVGQRPPSIGWRTDPGWTSLVHPMALQNLDAGDCADYLDRTGVQQDLHQAAYAFTHGHPLALALVGDVARAHGSLSPAGSADVIGVLLDRLLAAMPSPTHRLALEAASQVRVVNEPLLAVLLGADSSTAAIPALFDWMRGLPFVDAGQSGLYLHDLVRDTLTTELRWRDASRYASYHDRARQHYFDRLGSNDPMTTTTCLLDLIYLHPNLRQFLTAPEEAASLRLDPLALPVATDDRDAVLTMVRRHQGMQSEEFARHWLAARPETWQLVRDGSRAVRGAICRLPVESVAPGDDQEDPALAAARIELADHPPLRTGETATLFRFWLAAESYQTFSPVVSLLVTVIARHFFTAPGLAVTLLPFADLDAWSAFTAYIDQRRSPNADFSCDGHTYAVSVHDWRLDPPSAWTARLAAQEIGVVPPTAPAAPAAVLTEDEFTIAVRQALKNYPRPDRLRRSDLLRCKIITTRLTGSEAPTDQAALLQAVIKEAVETLVAVPADRRLHRVLVRAYLAPAPTLEKAAEVLGLPSSTFRRLLSTAVARVATLLWHRELDS